MSETRKKLLVLGALPPPVHGATMYFDTLLKTQVANDFDVIFVDLKFSDSITEYGRFSLAKTVTAIRYLVRLCLILITRRIDLVYAAISFTRVSLAKDIAFTALCRLFRKRVVCCVLGIGLENLYDQSGWLMKLFIIWGIGLYHSFVMPSLKMHARYFAKLIPLDKVRCVPFGIFTDAGNPGLKLLEASAPIKIIFYSNFIKSKGIDEALKCIPSVMQRNPNVSFLFVGAWDSEAHKDAAMRIVDSVGMGERLKFSGVVTGEAKKRYLEESDIFLLPTYYYSEGLPLAILEAMSYGCAIVCTDHAATTVAVEDGVNGLICRPHDPQDLAIKINQLVEDRQLLLRMQENSVRKFKQLFTAEQFGERLSRTLASLCNTN